AASSLATPRLRRRVGILIITTALAVRRRSACLRAAMCRSKARRGLQRGGRVPQAAVQLFWWWLVVMPISTIIIITGWPLLEAVAPTVTGWPPRSFLQLVTSV